MQNLLFLIPFLPLAGALILGVFGRRLSDKNVARLGCGTTGLSALVCLVISICLLSSLASTSAYTQKLWTWMKIGAFQPAISFRLDALSLVMSLVVSFVAFLIHIYSAEFMKKEDGYSRFFSYMNLFVAAMQVLVLADNLLFLYAGWEGVGLCSYLLIGFWYKDPANGRAARKAFVVTRIGDTAMAIALFLLFLHLGTFDIQALLDRAAHQWQPGSALPIMVASLLLAGAVGKSAQLPLQTWLPDAMAGPTPVSALIHAATMVTAGVYLIARTHTLFELAPPVQLAVAIVGTLTLLLGAFSALTQTDLKRVLAYSTMSQIGYMFLALGVGAWPAAIFHFMTHAFFKALLFLSAGAVILGLDDEHDIFKMGGLRKQMPWVFWTFLIGAASLSALPWVTAGFYSKDLILTEVFTSPIGSKWLWAGGLLGALLTSLYSFKLVFVVFFGEKQTRVTERPGKQIVIPLVILAALSLLSGSVKTWLIPLLSGVFAMDSVLPSISVAERGSWLPFVAAATCLIGIAVAYLLYLRKPRTLVRTAKALDPMDKLYDWALVRPFNFIARVNRGDFIDSFFDGIAWIHLAFNRLLSSVQTGRVRWYAAVIGVGTAILVILGEVL